MGTRTWHRWAAVVAFSGVFVGRSRPSATMDLVICLESATCIPRLGADPVEDCSVLATRARESGAVVHGVILKAPGKVIGRFCAQSGKTTRALRHQAAAPPRRSHTTHSAAADRVAQTPSDVSARMSVMRSRSATSADIHEQHASIEACPFLPIAIENLWAKSLCGGTQEPRRSPTHSRRAQT